MGPEGAMPGPEERNPAGAERKPTAAWNCLDNPRVGVCDQIRYLGLRVAPLDFPVNAARQRNH
jgi:hypothetical protein